MNEEKSNSAIRYEKYLAALARKRFYTNPDCEADVISKHYMCHAIIAMQLAEACDMRRQFAYGSKPELDELIICLVKQIKKNHLIDFGIKLEWHPNSENLFHNEN